MISKHRLNIIKAWTVSNSRASHFEGVDKLKYMTGIKKTRPTRIKLMGLDISCLKKKRTEGKYGSTIHSP